jgi:thioredoxin 1
MLNRGLSPASWLWKTLAAAMMLMIGLCGPLAAQTTPHSEAGTPSPTLARVFAAWKARQERITSFYFAWSVHGVFPKGYQFPNVRGLAGLRRGTGVVDKNVEFTIPQFEWSGEGPDRVRSDFSELTYSSADGWKETGRFRFIQNGFLASRLQVPKSSDQTPTISLWRKVPIKQPSNWFSSGDFLLQNIEFDLIPLRLAIRPLSPASDWSPENFRVISEDAVVGNVHCIQLQMDKVDHSEQCWVDPNRDYSVIRWERRPSEPAPLSVAIEVQQGVDHEWLPARWSWRLSGGPEGRTAAFEATVTRRMLNKALADGTFAADYPMGTRVYDASVDLPILDSDDQSGVLAPDEARVALNAIADAWLKRQTNVKTFKYTWRRDGEQKTINTFCVDGQKFMTEYKTPGWSPKSSPSEARPQRDEFGEGWPIHQSKTVFDGVDTRGLSFSDNPRWRSGIVNNTAGSDHREVRMGGDWYLTLVFRPFVGNLGGMNVADLRDPAKFRVRKQRGQIGNVSCVVIESEPHPGMQMSYWLDPARDYIPLRQHRTLGGEDRERVDISYRPDSTCGWAPTRWTMANVGMGGKVFNPISDTITDFTVNQPVPASDFQIETPAGAKVQDWRIDRRSARRKAADATREAKQKALTAAREAREAEEKAHPKAKPKPKPVYDPFANAAADVEVAFKVARETNKRVLIEFGANWCPGCRVLGVVLKDNSDVATALKKNYVLVLVDTDTESGRQLQEKYVPKRQRNSIPHLAVLDPAGKVLRNDDTTALEVDDDYSVPKLKAFLAEWAPSK